jgi:O-antigen/teichoic acid export membrane protein
LSILKDSQSQQERIPGVRLAKNTVWNLLGQGLPLIVGLVAIPLLIHGLGTERFGVLTLAWMVIGYFGLFDLGLGRALTKLVAEKLGAGQLEKLPGLIWTALVIMVGLGIAGALILVVLSPWLVFHILKIPASLQTETLYAFYLLGLSIPIVICTTGLRGILEAYQRFGVVNAIRIPMGLLTFLGPLSVLPFSKSLVPIVIVLAVGRLVVLLAHFVFCLKTVPILRTSPVFQKSTAKPLVSFGGWITISNIISPLMVSFDRFLIGSFVSMTAVTYYTTPYELVTRLRIIPTSLANVLFPAFSSTLVTDRARAARMFSRGVTYLYLVLFPLILIVVTFAREGLNLWVGAKFAQNSSFVLQCLAVGVLLNSLALMPFALVQSAGRADLTAKLHLMEFPLYAAALWLLVRRYGINGVAIAWVVRVALDMGALFFVSRRILPDISSVLNRKAFIFGGAIVLLVMAGQLNGYAVKLTFLALTLLVYAVAAWFYMITREEKTIILRQINYKQDA